MSRTGLIVASAAAIGLAIAGRQLRSQQPPGQGGSGIYTPAHRSLLDAMKDFFGYHPAPSQPIAFTHKLHLAVGLQCIMCHTGVTTGPDAQLPSVKLCMTCHQAIATEKPEIKKLAAYQARGEDVAWQRVYDYPPYSHVKFNHGPHIRAGIDCKSCHGDMTRQTVAVRSVNLTMGYCLDCHRQRKASVDCLTCHY